MDVLCIGLAGYDLIFPLPEYPREDGKYQTEECYASGGGPAANAACLLSRWGLRSGLACVLGDDLWGGRARAELEAAGTDLSLGEIRRGGVTPLSCIYVNRANGSRTIVNYRPPGEPLRLGGSGAASGPGPKLLLMDGHEPEASLEAMAAWPRAATVLDAGSRRRGTEILAGSVDYLIASAAFARGMTSLSDLEEEEAQAECLRRLRRLRGSSRGRVAVTLGNRGLIYTAGGGLRRLPAFPVGAVDTTAAGDVFHGAFAYCLLRDLPFEGALRFASAAAALSVTRPGGRGSIPELVEVESFLEKGDR